MKIEIVIAIIVGIIIGLGGMFGVVMLTTQKSPIATAKPTATPGATPIATASETRTPKSDTTWDDTPVVFKGMSAQTPFMIFTSDKGDIIVDVVNGTYEGKLSNNPGLNTYFAFTPSGSVVFKTRILSLQGIAKEQSIFVGSVTDIMQDGLQLKVESGTIEQVKFLANAQYFNLLKDLKKVALSDLAIGDMVTISGRKTEKEIIEASSAVVIPQKTVTQPTIVSGKITGFDKATVTIDQEGKGEQTLTTNATTKLFGLKSDHSVRARTKLIAKDTGVTGYAISVATGSAQVVRSLFISE